MSLIGPGKLKANGKRLPVAYIPTGRYLRAMNATNPSRAQVTRNTILRAAFWEFYQHGFQGGNLRRIVEAAEVTKGALFHHFAGKEELGHAVLDEVIGPLLRDRWLEPIHDAPDPIAAMQETFRKYIATDIRSGSWAWGCPLNNMAQEMSPLDPEFRRRIEVQYQAWRDCYAEALARGQDAGLVDASVDPAAVATLVVAAQMGIWGTGKYSQDEAVMQAAGEALCSMLANCRPAA